VEVYLYEKVIGMDLKKNSLGYCIYKKEFVGLSAQFFCK